MTLIQTLSAFTITTALMFAPLQGNQSYFDQLKGLTDNFKGIYNEINEKRSNINKCLIDAINNGKDTRKCSKMIEDYNAMDKSRLSEIPEEIGDLYLEIEAKYAEALQKQNEEE